MFSKSFLNYKKKEIKEIKLDQISNLVLQGRNKGVKSSTSSDERFLCLSI